ncbi:MAG TPA: PorV/PorQ family protein [Bacteroidota bacterium]|nr:PorV/PorQ family protein [Bacteroidota bacterium]
MKKFVLVLLIVTVCIPATSQTIAKYAGEFMAIGVGGRALGLGSSQVALANDATAGYWNPAALAQINFPELILMHDERFGSLVNYDYASVAIPYGTDQSFGLSLMRLGVDGISDTRNALIDYSGSGVLDASNRLDYDKVTSFNSADWAVYLSYASHYSPEILYGINFKFIRRTLAEFSATGVGFDVAMLYSPTDDWRIGLNAQDITTTFLAWSTGRDELISPTLKFGTAYFLDLFGGRFAPTCDVDLRFENRQFASVANVGPVSIDPHFGVEFDYKQLIALRAGYSDVKQLTLGAGIHFRKLDIDYSFARLGQENDLGDTHRISLRFVFHDERFAR